MLPAIGASDDVLPLLSDSTFDIVYIDGAHDFKSVKSDLRNASRLVVEGGVLCGDDLEAQLSQVNPRYAEENAHLDFVCDPE
ncbi:MAG: class I SAM-dependent methyltransferase, partial [Deltaproteobacteria bacterium]|nr:class I SAM-dependent methyltransferase [Deltaproteobacteria bacterium]